MAAADLRRPGSDGPVKTDVEELGPTRVKLTIEVPFEELKPSLDKAYREVAKQVRIPGFRPGHVPARIIDQRLGRGAVLERAINDAVPALYGRAIADNDVLALGQPDLEITQLDDGQRLSFTAEVDVRPKFDLPSIEGLPVTVDDAQVSPDEVEEYINAVRERFASLRTVDRAISIGDFVSIDLSASVNGEQVEDAQASGMSYEVGSGTLLDGLDEALVGMTAGDSTTFTAELAGGQRAGERAEVAVTVHSVKVKELPELDDEFAASASEYDTLGEFRAGTRGRLEGAKRMQQAVQARDRAMDALLDRVEIVLPERLVAQEIESRERSLDEQLERMGVTRESYLESRGITEGELDTELASDARRAVKAGFILDQIARQEELSAEQDEVSAYIIEQAYRIGVPPDRLASQIVDQGQVPLVVGEVLRAKALRLLAERAEVTDTSGRPVDIEAATAQAEETAAASGEPGAGAPESEAGDEGADPGPDPAR
jgi:trigger factor